jgi:hypothetical protein
MLNKSLFSQVLSGFTTFHVKNDTRALQRMAFDKPFINKSKAGDMPKNFHTAGTHKTNIESPSSGLN